MFEVLIKASMYYLMHLILFGHLNINEHNYTGSNLIDAVMDNMNTYLLFLLLMISNQDDKKQGSLYKYDVIFTTYSFLSVQGGGNHVSFPTIWGNPSDKREERQFGWLPSSLPCGGGGQTGARLNHSLQTLETAVEMKDCAMKSQRLLI